MKQKTGRRVLGFLLTLAMVITLLPTMSMTVDAAEYDGQIENALQEGDILKPGSSYTPEWPITIVLQSDGWGYYDEEESAFVAGSERQYEKGPDTTIEVSDNGALFDTALPCANGNKVNAWEVVSINGDIITLAGYAPEPVSYFDWDEGARSLVERTDDEACKDYTVLTSEMKELNEGWYVVDKVMDIDYLVIEGNVHLIICNDAKLTVKGFDDYDHIYVEDGGSLTIYAQSTGDNMGELIAANIKGNITINGGKINTNDISGDGGKITFNGGKINTAGISNHHKDIEINDGEITSSDNGISIQEAHIRINGGTVNTTTTNNAAAIRIKGGNVTISGGTVNAVSEQYRAFDINGDIRITGGTVTAIGETQAISGKVINKIAGTGWTDTAGKQGRNEIAINTSGQSLSSYKKVQFPTAPLDPVAYMAWNSTSQKVEAVEGGCKNYTEVTDQTAWGTADQPTWYVLKESKPISDRITVSGTVNLILCDGATLNASSGITVSEGNTLNIYGQKDGTGTLAATAYASEEGSEDSNGAAIGGLRSDFHSSGSAACGTINIHGGTVNANKYVGDGICTAAGIGGAGGADLEGGNGGAITVYSGTVNAYGNSMSAGIGSSVWDSSGGSFTMYGGTVTAVGGSGGGGISGGGNRSGTAVTAAIYGGTVIATGGQLGNTNYHPGDGIGYGPLFWNETYDHGTLTAGAGVTIQGSSDNTTWTTLESPFSTRYRYMKAEMASTHTHSFTYQASDSTITAKCSADDCPLPESSSEAGDHVATLTIAAPDSLTYDGTSKAAKITDENKIQGDAKVMYQKKTGESTYDTATETAPTNAGTYKASITLGTGNNSATASVEYTIAKADLTDVSVTQNGTLTYTGSAQTPAVTTAATSKGDQTVTFTYSRTQDGTYGDMPSVTNVSDCGTFYYKASAPNHNDTSGSFTVTMNKANQDAPAAPEKSSATINSITLKTVAGCEYKKGADGTWQDSPTFNGLTMNTEYSFYQRLKGDDNHNPSPDSDVANISTSNHTHNWSYQANGATITATCGNTDGGHTGAPTSTLTIKAPALTTYGGEGSADATIEGSIDGVTNPHIEYKKGSEALASAPTAAGTYTANITLDEATASVEYTIAPKPVKVSGITASDKIYNGNKTATLVTTGATFEGKLDSDTLTVTATGEFADANAGQSKTVSISGLTLGGTDKDNYILATDGQQTTTTAKITAKEVGLIWSNTELPYNGKAQKPTAEATGLIEGDECNVTVNGEQTNAGDSYTAEASSLDNSNYKLPANKTTTFKIVKADPTVTAPTPKTLTYNEQAQELVTGAVTEDGTVYYAIGENDQTAPDFDGTSDIIDKKWTTDIPAKTNAGT